MQKFAEFISEAITSGDLKSLLKKYDYSMEPEEIAYALGDESMETMTMNNIVKKINSLKMSKKDVEAKLKGALN